MELNKIFKDGLWSSEINVRDFVSHNITPYYGDASFLEGPTERTKAVWNRCLEALAEERENNGVRLILHKRNPQFLKLFFHIRPGLGQFSAQLRNLMKLPAHSDQLFL